MRCIQLLLCAVAAAAPVYSYPNRDSWLNDFESSDENNWIQPRISRNLPYLPQPALVLQEPHRGREAAIVDDLYDEPAQDSPSIWQQPWEPRLEDLVGGNLSILDDEEFRHTLVRHVFRLKEFAQSFEESERDLGPSSSSLRGILKHLIRPQSGELTRLHLAPGQAKELVVAGLKEQYWDLIKLVVWESSGEMRLEWMSDQEDVMVAVEMLEPIFPFGEEELEPEANLYVELKGLLERVRDDLEEQLLDVEYRLRSWDRHWRGRDLKREMQRHLALEYWVGRYTERLRLLEE